MTAELLFIILSGLTFGSFVTLAAWRLPREEDIVVKPSQCPQCKTKLGFKDLFPVLSWLTSGGKCRHCKNRIGIRYPLIELVTLCAFLLVYSKFGLTFSGVMFALFAVALLIMIVVDLEHYIIPDSIHVALLPLGLAFHWSQGTDWTLVLYGFLAGAGMGLALHHGYRFLRKTEGLGYGDVKFFAVAGVWLTISNFVPFLFFSGLFGVITGLVWRVLGRGKLFPFGPALALALFACAIYQESFNLLILMQEAVNIYTNNM